MPAPSTAARRKRRLEPRERRQALIDAALDCLSALGPHGAGVREICERAGASPGLLRHYFDGKRELVVEAYESLTRAFHGELHRALSQPGDAAEQRLRAFFAAYFSRPFTREERVGTYIAYWTLARTDPRILRIQRAAYRKLRRLLAPLLDELAADRGVKIDAEQLAISLIALLDGFWLDLCVDPKHFSRARTSSICWQWLEGFLRGSRPR